MRLAVSEMISRIDEYAEKVLGIPKQTLMDRSGAAVASAVMARVPKGSVVVFLSGKGNNGGDGYAAACKLISEYSVIVYDVFSAGQRTDEGKYFLNLYKSLGGSVFDFRPTEEILNNIKKADCIVDAIFGTGFIGELPGELEPVAVAVRSAVAAQKIAIDVPLGINADNGAVSEFAITVNATVALSYVKAGIVSYPARSFVGEIIYDTLGLPDEKIRGEFGFRHHYVDEKWCIEHLPTREENSSKGSFGKLLMITGSSQYRGAAHLGLEAALRGGVGLVSYLGEPSLSTELAAKYPEAIYKQMSVDDTISEEEISQIVLESNRHSATLIGSGSKNTSGLLRLTLALLNSEGTPLILDADAINALSTTESKGIVAIREAKRQVIITPHPLEFARLSLTDVASVQLHRLEAAEKFAKENKCIVVLKGAGTITTNGDEIYINSSGSSALAKAGSGDVLAGLIAALVAMGKTSAEIAAAMAVYYHAAASDTLADEYSTYGVTPSDLPKEIARTIAKAQNRK